MWRLGRDGVGGGGRVGTGQDLEVAEEGLRRGLEKLVVLRRLKVGSGGGDGDWGGNIRRAFDGSDC